MLMPKLVALALDGGPAFVDALQRVWDRGDAVFPLDPRLPATEAKRVLSAMAPAAIIESDGEQRSLDGGQAIEPGDALVVATSGTTGLPKGVVHTHAGVCASAVATSAAIGVDPTEDRWLGCLPLAHIGGLSVVTRALLTDTPLDVHPRFDVSAVREAAATGTTLVSLVTRALTQLDTNLFRMIVIGGAAPPPDRPINVVATYGMTESGSGIVYERKPIDGVEIRIDDDDEIWLRGPMMLRTYRDGTDPKDANGWFRTGDLGMMTSAFSNAAIDDTALHSAASDDEYLHVFGRRGDVIVTGAEKVWPARVEPLLNEQPGVAEAVVVGRPHPDWGHQVVAVIVPSTDQDPSLDQLRDAVRAQLPVWYAPQAIELVSALPKTALGKVRRDQI